MYCAILEEFGYDKAEDMRSARLLDGILRGPDVYESTRVKVRDKTVFVVGAGPSLQRALDALAKYRDYAVMIAADTAVKPLMKRGIVPDIITTDLDGDLDSHEEAAASGATMVVHAHGDNQDKLTEVRRFSRCMGTTQTGPVGRIRNLGGFTDGDRAVFLADHFGADTIILFGMDFGLRIGRHSETAQIDRNTKLAKLRKGRELLEWLSESTTCRMLTTSGHLKGFENITYEELERQLVMS